MFSHGSAEHTHPHNEAACYINPRRVSLFYRPAAVSLVFCSSFSGAGGLIRAGTAQRSSGFSTARFDTSGKMSARTEMEEYWV